MPGINKYEGKDRRRERIRNHIAKDLRTPKYGQQVIPAGRKYDETEDYFQIEYEGNDYE